MIFKFVVGPETLEFEAQLPVAQRVPWPLDSMVMYALDEERVVGRMGVMSIKFIEGTWADITHPTLGFRMMKQMEVVLAHMGNTHAMALVYDDQPRIADYLKHTNFERFPVTVYSKKLLEAT